MFVFPSPDLDDLSLIKVNLKAEPESQSGNLGQIKEFRRED